MKVQAEIVTPSDWTDRERSLLTLVFQLASELKQASARLDEHSEGMRQMTEVMAALATKTLGVSTPLGHDRKVAWAAGGDARYVAAAQSAALLVQAFFPGVRIDLSPLPR